MLYLQDQFRRRQFAHGSTPSHLIFFLWHMKHAEVVRGVERDLDEA
jgi:hypothetical protein